MLRCKSLEAKLSSDTIIIVAVMRQLSWWCGLRDVPEIPHRFLQRPAGNFMICFLIKISEPRWFKTNRKDAPSSAKLCRDQGRGGKNMMIHNWIFSIAKLEGDEGIFKINKSQSSHLTSFNASFPPQVDVAAMLDKYLRNALSLLFIICSNFFSRRLCCVRKNTWIAVYARRVLKKKLQKDAAKSTSTIAVDIEWKFINLLRRLSQREIVTGMMLARAMVNSFIRRDNMNAFE